MNIEQWKTEYAARLVTRGGVPQAEADKAADAVARDYIVCEPELHWPAPADCADEEMACWEDDEENGNGN